MTSSLNGAAHASPDPGVDVWITVSVPDHLLGRRLARTLHGLGYTVAPHALLNYADVPRTKLTPNDAQCVIVLWTPHAITEPQLHADARTAGTRRNLIEVALGGAGPAERFSNEAIVTLNRVETSPEGAQWNAVLARIKKHCGPPPNRKPDAISALQMLIAAIATIAGVGASGQMIANIAYETQEANARHFTDPAQPDIPGDMLAVAKRPSLSPTTDMPVRAGGPDDYIAPDTGTAPLAPVAPVAVETTAATPVSREVVVQGPEE